VQQGNGAVEVRPQLRIAGRFEADLAELLRRLAGLVR
jgi:hypothetical protein